MSCSLLFENPAWNKKQCFEIDTKLLKNQQPWRLKILGISNIFLSSVFVIHLLLASCWLRCVLLAQFAISVSASFRIRSDFVLDECALERIKGSKKYSFPSTNGRCPESGHFVITLTHGMTNGPLGIYYPFILCKNHVSKGNLCQNLLKVIHPLVLKDCNIQYSAIARMQKTYFLYLLQRTWSRPSS